MGLNHQARCQWRDPYLWNIACDFVVNGWLIEMGIGEMPELGGLYDEQFKGLSAEQQGLMRASAAKMRRTNSYFYKPDWTTGYWPAGTQADAVEDDAVMTGHYALTTSYTGNVELDVPANVNFLAPIEMSSPKLEKAVNLGD